MVDLLAPIPTWIWASSFVVLHILTFMMVFLDCMRHRREATSTILWIFIAWAFPLIGALVYLMLGVDRVSMHGFEKQSRDQKLTAARRNREDEELPLAYWRAVRESTSAAPTGDVGLSLDRAMNAMLPDHPLLGGNSAEPLICGDETYPLMLEAIEQARHHIHIQSFIIGHDDFSRDLLERLKSKAEEGVMVRLLYDSFGSTHAVWHHLFRPYEKIPNMRIAGWTQVNPVKRQFQLNLRNHRKIMVVDAQVAFCGGVNIADENISTDERQAIRDYHFMLHGPIVHELQYTFMLDWYYMTNESPATILTREYYPHIEPTGNARIRVLNGGPSFSEPVLPEAIFTAIVDARKQILMVTPYFVPTVDIIHAMRSAALTGLDVRLIVPRKNNHFYSGLACCALYDELLRAGVRIFEREPPFMHAKALVVDDSVALVGSANIDVRSLKLNYETNLVIYDEGCVNALKAIVLEDQAHSREVTLEHWRQRPKARMLLENFASLLTPVL